MQDLKIPFGLIPAFTILTLAAVAWAAFGVQVAAYVVSAGVALVALYTLQAYVKTRNPGHAVAFLYLICLSLFAGSGGMHMRMPDAPTHVRLLLVGVGVLWLCLLYLVLTRQIKWRGREILKLAAEPVVDTQDGFTERPLPVGKREYTRQEVMAFADFARRHLIALPHVTDDKVVLVPVKMGNEFGHIMGLHRDYAQDTWVAFGSNGEVSAHISREDYMEYRETLSFDQLCESLGNLFGDFLELFTRGEQTRIVDRMNAARVFYFC
ncbi:hypothetical protein ACFL6X_08970 [Candidatus Latescibacterota bacterium]